MKVIKNYIIHLLGGYTKDEVYNGNYTRGLRTAFRYCKDYADFLYGKPAEEWSEKMYEYIKRNV